MVGATLVRRVLPVLIAGASIALPVNTLPGTPTAYASITQNAGGACQLPKTAPASNPGAGQASHEAPSSSPAASAAGQHGSLPFTGAEVTLLLVCALLLLGGGFTMVRLAQGRRPTRGRRR